MISASHNPYADNGIKLFGPDGYKLSDDCEAGIEKLIECSVAPQLAGPRALGRARRIDDVRSRYIEVAKRTLPRQMSLDPLRIVVDCANGAGYKVAPEALWELGAEVFTIGASPDGFNINQDVGSTSPEKLIEKVRELRADIGIALDGDADRVLIIDERGRIVDGDQVMATIAENWLESGLLAKPGLVATVMSNLGLERYLNRLSLSLVRTRVGDRYVLERMRAEGYNLGGEQSGHIIMSDYSTTGDALVAALQVLAVVKRKSRPVSEVCHRFDPMPQILTNVRYSGESPMSTARVQAAIRDAQDTLGTGGRLVVRPSGTELLIRVMGEGDDEGCVAAAVSIVCEALSSASQETATAQA
jgi:phosphoglucosamine mutase